MTLQAQTGEDELVLRYFGKGFVGRFLDIGACDGIRCSNTYALGEAGWSGTLVEGSISAFAQLVRHFGKNKRLQLVHAVVAAGAGRVIPWWENATKFEGGFETGWAIGLASTTIDAQHELMIKIYGHRESWRKFWVISLPLASLVEVCPGPYDFVTIDTEGTSADVLCDLDLSALGTSLVCVEHNAGSDHTATPGPRDYEVSKQYCAKHGLTDELLNNGVNSIFAKPSP